MVVIHLVINSYVTGVLRLKMLKAHQKLIVNFQMMSTDCQSFLFPFGL